MSGRKGQWLAIVAAFVLALGLAPRPAAAQADGNNGRQRVVVAGTNTLVEAFRILVDYHVDSPSPARLAAAADDGMVEMLRQRGHRVTLGPINPGYDEITAEVALIARYEALANAYPTIEPALLTRAALRQMAAELNDGHTNYIPSEYAQLVLDEFEGGKTPTLGMVVAGAERTVTDVFTGGPAAAAGVQIGDRLVDLPEALRTYERTTRAWEVTCTAGERYDLELRPVGGGATRALSLDCTPLTRPSVEARLLGEIGYLQVRAFDVDTVAADARTAIEDLQGRGARGLVIDLRGNPGGRVEQGVELLRLLIPDGPLYSYLDREGQPISRTLCAAARRTRVVNRTLTLAEERPGTSCTGEGPILRVPLAVLVDGRSASTAELVAVALQERQAARLFGPVTSGSLTVSNIYALADESLLQISQWRFVSAQGQTIDRVGVRPHEEVRLSLDELAAGIDAPLERALDYLRASR